jgi:hypothetical protein
MEESEFSTLQVLNLVEAETTYGIRSFDEIHSVAVTSKGKRLLVLAARLDNCFDERVLIRCPKTIDTSRLRPSARMQLQVKLNQTMVSEYRENELRKHGFLLEEWLNLELETKGCEGAAKGDDNNRTVIS